MARSKPKKTIADIIEEVREAHGRAAVTRALVGFLRSKYISRDSLTASQQIAMPDGSPVSQDVLEVVASELEAEAAELEAEAKNLLDVEAS